MWITHAVLLQQILNGDARPNHATRPSDTMYTMLADTFADIQKRNDAMWFRNLPPRVLARLTEAVSDVTVSASFYHYPNLLPNPRNAETEFHRTHN